MCRSKKYENHVYLNYIIVYIFDYVYMHVRTYVGREVHNACTVCTVCNACNACSAM